MLADRRSSQRSDPHIRSEITIRAKHGRTRRRSESAYICQVHDNVMMYTTTRLHKHLPSNVLAQYTRRLPMIMMSSTMTACCGVCGKSIGNGVNIFVHFSSTPTSILNLTTSSTFHARVEYNTSFRPFKPIGLSAHRRTHTQK